MVEALTLKAQTRDHTGTRAARKTRKQGLLPAIIYGHKQEPLPILLNYHDLAMELQRHHRLLEIELDGKKEKLLVKEVQYNYLGDTIVHIDLTRVDLNERVTVTVAIELKGTPKGVSEGGVVDQMLSDVELECLVTDIPESIRLLINDLEIGHAITAGELKLPQGATLVSDPDTPVVALRVVAEEAEEEEEAVEGAAEPEVITTREKEDENADK